jgi:hypothetical protein
MNLFKNFGTYFFNSINKFFFYFQTVFDQSILLAINKI